MKRRALKRRYGRSADIEYNGWTNYETWNVALWINNDYAMYQKKQVHLEHVGKFTAASVRSFVKRLMPSGTPDFRTRGHERAYAKVDWQEIANSFNEE